MIKPFEGNFRITCDYECHLSYSSAPGIDWALPTGHEILAADDGVVVKSQWGKKGGRYLMISHGNGIHTLYSHLSKVYRLAGERVKAGQFIAESGNTGRSTGPHLHFAVKVGTDWVDPQIFLEKGE